jgi:uncharacterized OB-fold protein
MRKNFVTAATYWLLAEAELARARLADEGIEAFVAEGETATLTSALSNIRLLIDQSDLERALRIMAQWPAPRTPSERASSDLEPLRCLSCGKRMLEDQIQCEECGWSYLENPEGEVSDSEGAVTDQVSASEEGADSVETAIRRDRPRPKLRPLDRERPADSNVVRCPSCGQGMRWDQVTCEECGWSYSESEETESAPGTSTQTADADTNTTPPDSRIQRERPSPRSKRPSS